MAVAQAAGAVRLKPEDAWLATRPIAHRGLHDVAAGRPENSLAAFARAAEAGFPIELDVRLTADRQAVVTHDRHLRGTTGLDRDVDAVPLREVARLTLGHSDERVPRLAEVLELVDGRVPLLLDLKARVGSPLARVVLSELAGYRGAVALQDFSPWTLLGLRARRAGRPLGQASGRLVGAPGFLRPLGQAMPANVLVRPDFVDFELEALPNPGAAFWRRRGIPLLAWTARSPAEAARALSLADNYIFSGFVPAATAAVSDVHRD